MKTARTWFPEDKVFLKRLRKSASRIVEQIEAPMMKYYGRLKVGRKLRSWRTGIAAVEESIDRAIESIK
jgi:hypothetical protein